MMISTRGRYALRVLVDLAEHSGGLVPMKDVAARQGISKKYMEQIMALLVRDGYVEGVHGKGGGYRLGMRRTVRARGQLPHHRDVAQIRRDNERILRRHNRKRPDENRITAAASRTGAALCFAYEKGSRPFG